MKRSGCLINVARGTTTDWEALTAALETGQIAACYTDVAPQEPLPADSPLWGAPNLHITPHNSGNPDGLPGAGPRYQAAANKNFAAQLRRYLAGAPVFNAIDNELGY